MDLSGTTLLSRLSRAFFCTVVVVVFALGSTCGWNVVAASLKSHAHHQAHVYPLTGFGGYQSFGAVTQVSAQWVVPSFVSQRVLGQAATWVGAQNSGNKFIQLGVIVDCPAWAETSYVVFWSDAAKGYFPQFVGRIFPGDQVSASMVQNKRGWYLKFRDPSIKFSYAKEVKYAKDVSFTDAEWLQEDPAPANISAQDVPYPDITNVKFTKLKVDHRTPELTLDDGQTLSANGGAIRVPTPVRHDSFTFVRPKGVAEQYLVDARKVDFAENKFNAQLARWKSFSKQARSRYVKKLLVAFRAGAKAFRTQTWPPPTRRDVSYLVTSLDHDATNLKAWVRSGYKNVGSGLTTFEDGYIEGDRLMNTVRALLNLPPP